MKTTFTKINFTGKPSGDFIFTNSKGQTYTVQMASWQIAEARALATFKGEIKVQYLGRK